jgi:hypothetical protein
MGVYPATEQFVQALAGRFLGILLRSPDQLKTTYQESLVGLEHGAHAGAVFVTSGYAAWDKGNKNLPGDHLTSRKD